MKLPHLSHKGLFFLTTALVVFGIGFYFFQTTKIIARESQPIWGASFTKSFAEYLGLDWRKVYLGALDDLGIKYFRIGLNWDEVEREPGRFDFSDFDWMISEAGKRNAKVILALGRKLPRWPECRAPSWTTKLSKNKLELALLNYIEASVKHFKDNSVVRLWQIENEPFFRFFGSGCPSPNKKLLEEEMALVRFLDPTRLVMITDSGELSLWWKSANLDADILGVSMYRRTWNKYFGFREYPFPPWVYNMKARLINSWVPRIVISELQAEPWAPEGFHKLPPELEAKTMDHKKFNESFKFARQSGFDEIYLWGVEWWYYKKERGDDFYWDTIKSLKQ